MNNGTFLISLDFELYWGMHDVVSLSSYRENILGARVAIPEILRLFDIYQIHATWAVVGMLFAPTKDKLMSWVPRIQPHYDNQSLSSYRHLEYIGENEHEDPYHYAGSLIEQIDSIPCQEIGTHTFSHYYCLEPGQTFETFKADLVTAVEVVKSLGYSIHSLVFPRNQVSPTYIDFLKEIGILAYRGTEDSWIYNSATHTQKNNLIKRILRLIDAYIPLTGQHSYSIGKRPSVPLNLPASRSLRSVNPLLSPFESLRLQRITREMTYAAQNNLTYHLWWHPHNFGKNMTGNMEFLDKILKHYCVLRDAYSFQSANMGEIVTALGVSNGDGYING